MIFFKRKIHRNFEDNLIVIRISQKYYKTIFQIYKYKISEPNKILNRKF